MRKLAQILKWFIGIIIALVLILYITDYDYILKGIRVVYMTGNNTAFIDDYTYFDNRTIETSTPQALPKHQDFNTVAATNQLQELNKKYQTVAFLIIKNDSIWYEDYAADYGVNSYTNSFSMAKSITTMLLGKAISDGHIESLNQRVVDFFPNLKGDFAEQLEVGDLASMASGLNWEEDYYSPFSMTAKAYYDTNIRNLILGLEVDEQPGKSFQYLSGNTQLLAMVIEKATGQNLSYYLSQNFWKPMQMNNRAYWQLDSQQSGMEKAYCCISSNAEDFAKIGMLYKNQGKWNGEQLLDASFVEISTQPRFADDSEYGYGFWLSNYRDKSAFVMQGILGQYVITIPEDDLVIVRLGHQRAEKPKGEPFPSDFYQYIDEVYKMLPKVN
ncbi:MAG: serine hydrolase domain-containing protein [Bacteroidota bacterium]